MIIEVNSETQTKKLAEKIGKVLVGGEVVELVGDIGAGKTTFVKGLARGLGVKGDVQSPSFTLSRVYKARNNLELLHYDFYRLNDPGILANELAELAGSENTITVIEWADIVEDVLPSDHVRITFKTIGVNQREITIPDKLGAKI